MHGPSFLTDKVYRPGRPMMLFKIAACSRDRIRNLIAAVGRTAGKNILCSAGMGPPKFSIVSA